MTGDANAADATGPDRKKPNRKVTAENSTPGHIGHKGTKARKAIKIHVDVEDADVTGRCAAGHNAGEPGSDVTFRARDCDPVTDVTGGRSGVGHDDAQACLEGPAMTARQALLAAQGAGVRIALDGCDLVLEAAAEPPADVIALLARHKAAVVALLRETTPGSPPASPPVSAGLAFDPATLQAEADQRNARAAREHSTDRFCACGSLAESGYPDKRGGMVWRCWRCFPVLGRA